MDDALTLRQKREIRRRPEFADIAVQRRDLLFARGVGDAVVTQFPAGGGRVVVGGRHDGTHAPHLALGFAQPFKRLGAGHFVNQMPINVEDGRSIFLGVDDVFVPELIVQGACHVISQREGLYRVNRASFLPESKGGYRRVRA